jgi:hypothetical protein
MDSRGAKMKDYNDFRSNLIACTQYIKIIDEIYLPDEPFNNIDFNIIENAYKRLDLMSTNGKLVSNSKLLHFLFPKLCMPMDTTYTLKYLYGSNGESPKRFTEINKFVFNTKNRIHNINQYLDDNWNTTSTKIIDNAIMLLVRENL